MCVVRCCSCLLLCVVSWLLLRVVSCCGLCVAVRCVVFVSCVWRVLLSVIASCGLACCVMCAVQLLLNVVCLLLCVVCCCVLYAVSGV